MERRERIPGNRLLILLGCFFILMAVSGCSVFSPYDNHPVAFTDTFTGVPETPKEAYFDSKHNINPARFDKKWIEQRKAYEKKYCRLIEARAKALGLIPENASLCKDLSERSASCQGIKTAKSEKSKTALNFGVEIPAKKEKSLTYRALLFSRMKKLLEEPATPMVVPPEVIRALVMPLTLKEKDGRSMYITAYYIYFFLDRPHWVFYQAASPESRESWKKLPGNYLILKPFSSQP